MLQLLFANFYHFLRYLGKWNTNHKRITARAVKQFPLSWKPTVFVWKAISKIETTCQWKHFKEDKFLYYGDRLRKFFKWINIPRQHFWESQPYGTHSPGKATGGLMKILKCKNFPWSRDILSEKFNLFVMFLLVTQLSIKKNFMKRRRNSIFHSHCGVVVKSTGETTYMILTNRKYISLTGAVDNYTTDSFLIIRKDFLKTDCLE